MPKKTVYEKVMEKLHPMTYEDFDKAFGLHHPAADIVRDYKSTVINERHPETTDYVMGKAIDDATRGDDISKKNIGAVCETLKEATDAYKKSSAVGRFFSYIFPNKYRQMRNEIKEAKQFLTETKGINAEDLEAYCNGEKTADDVRFEENGPMKSNMEKFAKFEQTSRGKVLNGQNVVLNLVDYVRAQECGKYFSHQSFDSQKDVAFIKDTTRAIDTALTAAKEGLQDNVLPSIDGYTKEVEDLFRTQEAGKESKFSISVKLSDESDVSDDFAAENDAIAKDKELEV